ncbi:DUF2027 domain-containing protein [Hoylesella timonensis]|uniref:DNA mismatch repair protein n=2 Tax=Hoylesella timonensis TaxID=386414 RepID=A0A098YRB9_9BACT|nr:DUF2027 domain-containing protein [Hoylesella timonensis]KGI22270.1 DNA mismatch repair protein [Hoylesella timonensis S9-PR14]PMC10617.1 DUF2027 domain-containing protein [Hoylesella timonensis]
MKIGDKVRFLSESGGGVIAGFQGKNIVLVEDEDGFQIPTPINDVIQVIDDDYSTGKVVGSTLPKPTSVKNALTSSATDDEEDQIDDDPSTKEITFRTPVEERKGGNLLSCYLAFVPMDMKDMTHTRFESYFVNDSNYYVRFTYLSAEGNSWKLKSSMEVEPNTKEFIEEFGKEDLNDLGHVAIQLLSYKRDKSFMLKPTIDVQFRIDTVKFYKLHTFQENDFFELPALLYTIVENDKVTRPLVVDSKQLKEEMYQKEPKDHIEVTKADEKENDTYVRRYNARKQTGNPFQLKHRENDDIVVVDLHAHELLDTTTGMSAIDILNFQLQKFRDTLQQYKDKKGQRIVFIHGKGEGVLRRALINDLNYRYKKYQYQDASFQEYGYGATQVTIR